VRVRNKRRRWGSIDNVGTKAVLIRALRGPRLWYFAGALCSYASEFARGRRAFFAGLGSACIDVCNSSCMVAVRWTRF
jgi:hypothetical protein